MIYRAFDGEPRCNRAGGLAEGPQGEALVRPDRAHFLESAILSAFEGMPSLDSVELFIFLSSGRFQGWPPSEESRAYMTVTRDTLAFMEAQGKVTRGDDGRWRLVSSDDDRPLSLAVPRAGIPEDNLMYDDHIRISTTRSDEESWRIDRLNRVLGYVFALADRQGVQRFLGKVVEISDHKGTLTVRWGVQPTDEEKELFLKAWESAIGDGCDNVEHVTD